MTEFVAGSIEGKDSALATAKREFQEETGYKAKKWVSLGEIYVAVSTNRAKGIVYLAEDLTKTDNNKMKEDGIESAIVISQKELEKQIASGEITDSKTIAAYFIAKQYLKIR
jgi:ADP-ribose pyrophosphatase